MEQKNTKTRGVRKPKLFRGMFYFLKNDLATLLRFPAAQSGGLPGGDSPAPVRSRFPG
jgi:hypothetical protein